MTSTYQIALTSIQYITSFPSKFPSRHWKSIRLSILLSLDLLIVVTSYYMAFLMRLETPDLGLYQEIFSRTVWIYVLVHAMVFCWLGMYRQIWRYANFNNAVLISFCTLLSTAFSALVVSQINFEGLHCPKSIPFIFWLISTMLIALLRYSWRGLNTIKTGMTRDVTESCFIYGAGGSGELLARYIKENANFPYRIIGFIDDDLNKIGRSIHGRKIMGTGEQLPKLAKLYDVSTVIVAMNAQGSKTIREVVSRCHKIGIRPMIMPEIAHSIDSDTIRPRKVDLKDILRRSPKSIDHEGVSNFFQGKTVLVTGAGGTIGSEISRQVLSAGPAKLLLLDNCEYNLYRLETQFHKDNLILPKLVYLMGSIADQNFIEKVFTENNIDCVLHAAAYKHVHLVEANPSAGVNNNILGTKILVDVSLRHRIKNFLLISSDKAVRPTGVMGKTKRICELYLQAMNDAYGMQCNFCSVRFGNVLGSSGSVIPRFMEQIENGGPVTITHPDMTRYFMLVSEAVNLVLQSMILTKGGEIFVLKMGEPVNILEMAKQLISLAGKRYLEDIDIAITGLRPGEKLFEELLYEGSERKTDHDDIFIVHPKKFDNKKFIKQFDELLTIAKRGDDEGVLSHLTLLVEESFIRMEDATYKPRLDSSMNAAIC